MIKARLIDSATQSPVFSRCAQPREQGSDADWLASPTGFERLCAEEFRTGDLPGEASWGLCLVLPKV